MQSGNNSHDSLLLPAVIMAAIIAGVVVVSMTFLAAGRLYVRYERSLIEQGRQMERADLKRAGRLR